MELLVDAAADQDDVFYVILGDITKLFQDRQTGECYAQLAIPRPTVLTHPDAIVIELARIIGTYDIVEEMNL